jgi:hypothetical protein
MRRSSVSLIWAFVCLLVANVTLAQSPALDSSASTESTTEVALTTARNSTSVTTLSSAAVAEKLAEAKRLLNSREDGSVSIALAALDPRVSEIHVLTLAKESFLTKGADVSLTTHLGKAVRLRIIRPNGVNTAVTITDITGHSLLPLLVKYPIIRDGAWSENAFYTSAHPALLSSNIVAEGQRYLTTMFAQAAADLKSSGVTIPADIVEVAKHLVIVEHTDHKRFREENRAEIYPEVLALYALNQGNTYRYSVSSAGAGGMIQMIPRTYEAIRQQHPNVSLQADFVSGMQNHANALKAQLLYINDTWKFLQGTTEVQDALRSGTASKIELLAAGYNSNPYRLPQYLSNGGSAWRALIPAETQMYLAIYQSVDRHVDFGNAESVPLVGGSRATPFGTAFARQASAAVISWLGKQVLSNATVITHLMP